MQETKCAWALNSEIEQKYHDEEWGRPVYDDQILFEFIILEGAQAGLSWVTILKKRDEYRRAFLDFAIDKLALLDDSHVESVIADYAVIKNKRKIASVYSNARAAQKLQQEYGSLSAALWQFVDHSPRINHWQTQQEVPVFTEESKAMSRFLKKKGFKFVGDTICYSLMQATGMVNDHLISCPFYPAPVHT